MGLTRERLFRKSLIWLAALLGIFCITRAWIVSTYADEMALDSSSEDEERSQKNISSVDQEPATLVRLTQPREGAQRRYIEEDDPEYALVPGIENLMKGSSRSNSGRAPASLLPETTAAAREPRIVQQEQALANERSDQDEIKPVRIWGRPLLGLEKQDNDVATSRKILKLMKTKKIQNLGLILSDEGIYPKNLVVTQGIPVRIYVSTSSKRTLCLMNDQFQIKQGVVPSKIEEIVFVPNREGTFRLYCPVQSLEASLTVRAPKENGDDVLLNPSLADTQNHQRQPAGE